MTNDTTVYDGIPSGLTSVIEATKERLLGAAAEVIVGVEDFMSLDGVVATLTRGEPDQVNCPRWTRVAEDSGLLDLFDVFAGLQAVCSEVTAATANPAKADNLRAMVRARTAAA